MPRPEPKGEKGEPYVPPTEEEWLKDAIEKVKVVIAAVQHGIPAAYQIVIVRDLADKLVSPYHYFCQNDKVEWNQKFLEASRRPKKEGEQDKGKAQEAPGPEKDPKPLGDQTSGNQPAGPSKEPDKKPSNSESPGASKIDQELAKVPVYANMPAFRVGMKGELIPVCPKEGCGAAMCDNRPDPRDPGSRTQPNPNTGNRRPDFKCEDPNCEWGIWLLTKEENQGKRGSAARAKKDADKILGGKK